LGCLKLTYHTEREHLNKNLLFVVGGLEKKCAEQKNRVRTYGYGFNGQEKDDEVAGAGNSYTAEYWQYDSRLGRRWNIDPVVKHYESPYAAFANTPIWVVDPNGADSLIMHRSGPIKEFTDYESTVLIYKVTFSVVKNGVETNLNQVMYMMQNADASKYGDNGLNKKEYYTLKFDQMQYFNGNKGFENTIRVTNFGVFIHPGNKSFDFYGCAGMTCQEPNKTEERDGDWSMATVEISNTSNALQVVRDMYNTANGEGNLLTGDKFLLKTNSRAPLPQLTKMTTKKAAPIAVDHSPVIIQ